MSTFDRSKFKATKTEVLKSQEEMIDSNSGTNESTRVPFIEIEEGDNKLRIYPAHPDTDSFIVPKSVSWLPREVEEYVDGKKTGKKLVKRLPVFNSKIHSTKGVDLVEEYILYIQQKMKNDGLTADKIDSTIKLITNFEKGISPQLKWVFYTDKIKNKKKTFGQAEISNKIREDLNKIAISDDEDEPITIDPFTDPNEGRAVILNKDVSPDKNGKPRTSYSIKIDFKAASPLSDEELEKFMKYESLEKRFKDSFKRKDFEHQLEGLERFDIQHKLGVFEEEGWLDICEKLSDLFPETIEDITPSVGKNDDDLPFTDGDDSDDEDLVEDGEDEEVVTKTKTVTAIKIEPKKILKEEKEEVKTVANAAQSFKDRFAAKNKIK